MSLVSTNKAAYLHILRRWPWWPRGRGHATNGVSKPPEATDPTQQNMTGTMWALHCPPAASVILLLGLCVGSVRPSWQGKGNTRAVFVQGTGLSSVARTHTNMHTHLAKTEAYCGRPARSGPPTTVMHCITFCISASFLQLSITDCCLFVLLSSYHFPPLCFKSFLFFAFITLPSFRSVSFASTLSDGNRLSSNCPLWRTPPSVLCNHPWRTC